jgi:hypothetical protein
MSARLRRASIHKGFYKSGEGTRAEALVPLLQTSRSLIRTRQLAQLLNQQTQE